MVFATESHFLYASRPILAKRNKDERDFITTFGSPPHVCALAWNMFVHGVNKIEFKHFLWGCMFIKTYAKAAILAALAGVCKETFMKVAWKIVILISGLASRVACAWLMFAALVFNRGMLTPRCRFFSLIVFVGIKEGLAR